MSFELRADGRKVSGCTSTTWAASLEELCATLTIRGRVKGFEDPEDLGIVEDAPFELLYNGEFLMSGEFDAISRQESGVDGTIFSATARDDGKELLISSIEIDAWEFKKTSPLEFTAKVAGQHGLKVVDKSGGAASKLAELISIDPGEEGFAAIERELRYCGCFCRMVGKTLEVYRPERAHSGYRIVDEYEGVPSVITGGSAVFNVAEKASRYVVKSNERYGGRPTLGEALDPDVKKKSRVRVMVAEKASTSEEVKARAVWEMTVARGRAFDCSFSVPGSGPEPGKIWRPGMLLGVKRRRLKIDSDGLLVSSVAITESDAGTSTELGLKFPDAFSPAPRPANIRG